MQNKIKITYLDSSNFIIDVTMPIPEDMYRSDISYKENLGEVVAQIAEEGGFWVDDETIIPTHRILSYKACNEINKPKEVPKEQIKEIIREYKEENKQFRRHSRRFTPKNEHIIPRQN